MKAKDLAAIAALGIAGKMAYDKFGRKKDDEPKTKGELGKSKSANDSDAGESEARMDNYSNEGRNAKFANEDYSNEGRGSVAPDYSNEGRGKTAPVAVAKPVRTPVVTRSVAAAAPAAPITSTVQDNYSNEGRNAKVPVSAQMPDASRVTPYNSDIMYNTTVKSDPNVAHDDEMNRLARTRATRQGAVVAQSPNDQAQARILRQGATTAQATPYNSDIMYNTTVKGDPSINDADSEINQQAYTRMARQGTAFAQSPNDQAQARLLRQGAGRAKGGVVKMASGGMTSSKPSGASRGDGIAQRGRTRGKYL